MNSTSQARKKIAIPEPLKPEPDPPCFSEKVSALTPTERREIRKWFKETILNLEEAKSQMIAYREDNECAFDTLNELTFLIDDLFARCIDLIELHPGIDDLGEGHKLRPQHQNFEQRKCYGKLIIVEDTA